MLSIHADHAASDWEELRQHLRGLTMHASQCQSELIRASMTRWLWLRVETVVIDRVLWCLILSWLLEVETISSVATKGFICAHSLSLSLYSIDAISQIQVP